jgi:multidrug efflux pump subunit AcrB
MAVFVPVAFLPGVTGRLYNRFALTIAISVAIFAFNSLTLSPALSAAASRSLALRAVPPIQRGLYPCLERLCERGAALHRRTLVPSRVQQHRPVQKIGTAGLTTTPSR